MNIKAIIHEAEEGGLWAEVPALPGCVTQGETMDEIKSNLREAVEGWLLVGSPDRRAGNSARICCMKAVSGKRLSRLAEMKGWNLARVTGSHHI
ncbi:hypothetical protein SCALIN_C05_0204 [Candidatus Scalindua japonica]|uniref:Uncharacterized protein n=1 Tax=Candidatus Scalindua japonica TaxID=1284222 RepID=A0A286TW53_9BACT|nr:type II toxin-antitoxin system HicB family antitoxin [Candidatus Scalindua japonica]GAX60119.1 hypothetical protein SCALIN_C05_0204 [Candidatus Scalindua japonica]